MAMMGTGAASGEGRARAAAEAAVSSPLLEDINLAGAHGILVNVTAGMDLSIGEFEEVGQIVKQFASEDATVVVGTVIDPELSNQVRVTVVATGLGRPAAAVRRPMQRACRAAREHPRCGATAPHARACVRGGRCRQRLRGARQADGAAHSGRSAMDCAPDAERGGAAGHPGVPAAAGRLM